MQKSFRSAGLDYKNQLFMSLQPSNPLKTVLNDHIFKANRDRHLSEKDYDGPDSCIDEVDLDNFMNNPKVL